MRLANATVHCPSIDRALHLSPPPSPPEANTNPSSPFTTCIGAFLPSFSACIQFLGSSPYPSSTTPIVEQDQPALASTATPDAYVVFRTYLQVSQQRRQDRARARAPMLWRKVRAFFTKLAIARYLQWSEFNIGIPGVLFYFYLELPIFSDCLLGRPERDETEDLRRLWRIDELQQQSTSYECSSDEDETLYDF